MAGKYFLIFTFLLTQTLINHTVYAAVYKWVDENGNIVYGDKPNSNNADKIKIKKAPKQDEETLKRINKQQKLLDVMQEERDEKIAFEQEEKEKEAKQKKECARISKELKEMKEARFLYEDTDDPYNPKIVSNEQRGQEETKYERYIKENC